MIQNSIVFLFKGLRIVWAHLREPLDWLRSYVLFYVHGVRFSTFHNSGCPRIRIDKGGRMQLGKKFRCINRELVNPIGRFHRCSFNVGPNAQLIIGDRVGMSATAIVCHQRIEIGNDVQIGANVVIYDTDFHSLDAEHRKNIQSDRDHTRRQAVRIGAGAFIGAHSTILKGVEIGAGAVIGACSVVTKSIPANEIWAGNPARKLRALPGAPDSTDNTVSTDSIVSTDKPNRNV